MLESVIRDPDCRAECLPTNRATISTSFLPGSLVNAAANDDSGAPFLDGGQCRFGELTLDRSWTLPTIELVAAY